MSDWIQIRKARTLLKGCPGPQGPQGPTLYQGNVAIVDSVYGNDSTGSMSGSPYKTIEQALSHISSGQTMYILPGTYSLTRSLQLPDGISIHGMSAQTTIIEMVDVSSTMITMGENCLIEGLSLKHSGNDIRCILFNGTSSQTSKLRTLYIYVTTYTSTNATGIEFAGNYLSNSFSLNSVKNCIIHIYSDGAGIKRGILVSGSNIVSIRDTNVYVYEPSSDSTGSYVGIETNDSSNIGTIQLRNSTIGVVLPSSDASYSASDILQTTPNTISDPTYLASPGIQIGPGTDLVSKSAGGKGFSTYVYPTIIYYGLKGDTAEKNSGYLWPGTQKASGDFPDTNTITPAYFRVQQPSIISGLSAAIDTSPGTGNSVILSIHVTPLNTSRVDTSFSVVLSENALVGTYYNSSFRCGTGDFIHMYIDFSGNKVAGHNVTAQIDLF